MIRTTLTKEEREEHMFKTWGRIVTRARDYSDDKRLKELVEKFNEDLGIAKFDY